MSDKPLTAKSLAPLLQNIDVEDRKERTLTLKMVEGKRPEVVFTGFWNWQFIKAGMTSIGKAYRLRKHDLLRRKQESQK